MLLAMLVGALPVAHASHVPDCLDDDNDPQHPTNSPTAGDDVFFGTPDRDVLAGGAGDDVIYGNGGRDVLCGNEGNDKIKGGGDGVGDVIHGGPGDDQLGGGECVPRDVPAHPSCPSLTTGDAGETNGSNYIFGDEGLDSIMGSGTRDGILAGDNAGVERVYALNGDDYIGGGSGVDSLDGGPGSDVIEGGGDFDDLYGGEGNYGDDLYASTIFTGPIPEWPQTCETNGELMGVSGPAESGDGEVTPTPPAWPYFGPANELFGGDGYDLLVGAARKDVMWGNERGDDLYGLGGNDVLVGNRASDCLSGGPEGDRLFDTDGPTELEQLDDTDTLWGGDDNDHLNARDFDNFDTVDGGPPVSRRENCYADGTYIVGDVVRECARRTVF
jgi:Ca2+-binding RTX toxin-like protein